MASDLRVTLPVLKVLNAMLETRTEDHWGFELIKATGLKSGTLYPVLARLEAAGWVESGWESAETHGRPRRRYYRLTGVGEAAAIRELARAPGWQSRSDVRPVFGFVQ